MDTTSAPKSCTAPTKIAPITTHSIAGSQPQMTAMAGAEHRRQPGDRGVLVAEQHVGVGRHVVDFVAQADGRRRPVRIDGEDPLGEKARVDAVGDHVGRDADQGGEQW